VLKSLIEKELIKADRIFLKTPVSIRTNPLPSKIYDHTMSEIESLSIENIKSLFLNKLSAASVVRFMDSIYYDKLIRLKSISSLGLIISRNTYQGDEKILLQCSSKIEYISILSNMFNTSIAEPIANSKCIRLVRSVFSSGLISDYLKHGSDHVLSKNSFFNFDGLKDRIEYLQLLQSTDLLTVENCIHFPLYLSKAQGIILSTSNPKHLYSISKNLANHDSFVKSNLHKIKEFQILSPNHNIKLES